MLVSKKLIISEVKQSDYYSALPKEANDLDDDLDCSVFLTFFIIMLNYNMNYAIISLNIFLIWQKIKRWEIY